MKQVEESKKEREAKLKTNKSSLTKTSGAVIGTVPRFKYSEAEQIVNEQLPGPGSYDSVYVKDIQMVRTSPKKPTPASLAAKNFSTPPAQDDASITHLVPDTD